jgi:hypothetical protein
MMEKLKIIISKSVAGISIKSLILDLIEINIMGSSILDLRIM